MKDRVEIAARAADQAEQAQEQATEQEEEELYQKAVVPKPPLRADIEKPGGDCGEPAQIPERPNYLPVMVVLLMSRREAKRVWWQTCLRRFDLDGRCCPSPVLRALRAPLGEVEGLGYVINELTLCGKRRA